MYKLGWQIIFVIFLLPACDTAEQHMPAFQRLSVEQTGIAFRNDLSYDEYLNAYTYRNFYNGAGVGVGDINNDGLQDLYFAGNLVDNKLYLNKGDLRFEDITNKAGVASANVWSTGVSMADVNGDGWLDIYVCKSGPLEGGNRNNSLFINNGDLTFTDRAEEYGVADLGLSNHAAFMDYDKDGDLDFYLLNNSTRSVGIYDLRKGQRNIPDPYGGNKLYRNDGGRFTDVTAEAGIYSSAIGYGLGVTVADVNVDGWPDVFVSNDFFERDYLYINQKDGTFKESLETYITEISMGSMGADIADLNGDGYPEIYVTEMLPESMERVKTKTVFEDWDKYQSNIKSGYHHQFTRNVLQLNQGPVPESKDSVFFSEVSRMKNLHATDWSWGALMFDYNNDGKKDLFVANGVYKDLTDQDYVNFYANNVERFEEYKKDSSVITRMIDAIPSVPLPNYLFENGNDFNFENVTEIAGLSEKSFSNGAAYADLDNDGDLELIVNNINDEAYIYKNNTQEGTANTALLIDLKGSEQNPFAFGTRVTLYTGNQQQTQEHNPVKGYMSSMDYRMHFGLGKEGTADSLDVTWPDGSLSRIRAVPAGTVISLKQSELPTQRVIETEKEKPLLNRSANPIPYRHEENEFSDFNRDRLIFQMASNEGPAAAVADVNGDGLEDVFLGGAKGQVSKVFVQTASGAFSLVENPAFEADVLSEDVDAVFSDLDQDGDVDLLVASGGNEYAAGAPSLKDRIYLNKGNGMFEKVAFSGFAPSSKSSSFIRTLDFDQDGDQDVLVGTRLTPFSYGIPGGLSLFENRGDASFINVTDKQDGFKNLGMITDALAEDLDNDGDPDIVIVGEWMPVRVFINNDGIFEDRLKTSGLEKSNGLWKTIESGDFNGDGLTDFVVGNMGLNTRLRASVDEPLTMHINDFDQNGSIEQITAIYEDGVSYPVILLQDLVKQLPGLRKKYIKYDSYKDQTMADIFDERQLANMLTLKTYELGTCLFLNQGDGRFEKVLLPEEAQISQTYAVKAIDLDEDGISDLVLGGNQTRIKPELGINNASYGLTLRGLGGGRFKALKAAHSGLFVKGEVRQILEATIEAKTKLLFVRNNEGLVIFERNEDR